MIGVDISDLRVLATTDISWGSSKIQMIHWVEYSDQTILDSKCFYPRGLHCGGSSNASSSTITSSAGAAARNNDEPGADVKGGEVGRVVAGGWEADTQRQFIITDCKKAAQIGFVACQKCPSIISNNSSMHCGIRVLISNRCVVSQG